MFIDNLKSRGYLPHFDRTGYVHTIRISEFDVVPPTLRQASTKNPYGSCHLRDPDVAKTVVASLKYQHQQNLIDLFAFIVMPNHIHFLARFNESISKVVSSLKSFTGREINSILGRSGAFWQREYFDRWIATEDEFRLAKSYIELNPVRAGLCDSAEEWPYSSAFTSIDHL